MNSVCDRSRPVWVAAIIFAWVATWDAGAAVVRGPYLQTGTPRSVIVRWRSSSNEDSRVRYGRSFSSLTGLVSDATLVTEHGITLSNLLPSTKYFYEIGNGSNWFGGSTNQFVITAPPVGTRSPTRIWALGDPGTQNSDQAASRDSYTAFNGSHPTDVWLLLGDIAYSSGTEAEVQGAVFDFYPTYLPRTVVWPTIGNHEAQTSQAGPYLTAFTLPQNGEAGGVPSGTERYYSFDYANIHFICLDSATSDRTSNSPMCVWLEQDLANATQDWLIAYWHHPPYTHGSHNSDSEGNLIEVRQNIVPILENYGVDMVLNGHSHGYERTCMLDGHYGLSSTLTTSMKKDSGDGRATGDGVYEKSAGINPHEGVVYTVAGSSGHATGGTYDHPAMKVSLDLVGSLVIDVLSNRIDVMFLLTDGTAGDTFTMIKQSAVSTNPPAAPSALAAVATSPTLINLTWRDNSADEAGFQVDRSTNGVNFTNIAVTVVNVTNFSDTGLAPQRTYYYRVRSYSGAGNSAWSSIAQATTPAVPQDTTPPGAVTNLALTSITSNSATLTWTAPGDDGYVGTAARYDVRYSTNLISTSN